MCSKNYIFDTQKIEIQMARKSVVKFSSIRFNQNRFTRYLIVSFKQKIGAHILIGAPQA
jgi:hypothetical protein